MPYIAEVTNAQERFSYRTGIQTNLIFVRINLCLGKFQFVRIILWIFFVIYFRKIANGYDAKIGPRIHL